MDISILLAFQNFRNGIGIIFVDFFKKMTFFGELNTTLVFLGIIYWCISKELGTYLMMGWSGNRLVNGFLKVTFCAYRPWIRDPRIIPHGDSMLTATGYSFPSGHSTNAASIFGGTAMKTDLPRSIRVALFVVVLLVGLSRMFLGVHTPQDILIGISASLLVMFLTLKLMNWLDSNPSKDILVACIGIALSIALAVYAALKSYPVDYDANGKIIVEGAKMANDTFKAVGWVSAFLIGWVLEKRFVGFTTETTAVKKLGRALFGLLGYYSVSFVLNSQIKLWLSGPAATIITCFLQMFYISFLFPFCIKKFEKAEI